MRATVLQLYDRLARWPAGRWLFSRAVCFKAPYFASIAPRVERRKNSKNSETNSHQWDQ